MNKHSPISIERLTQERLAAMQAPDDLVLDPAEASVFLGLLGVRVAQKTLDRWRCVRSDGPAYGKTGKYVVYRASALREFAARETSPKPRNS